MTCASRKPVIYWSQTPTRGDTVTDLERAIRRLERWHRDWEIRNRDRLAHPTFATEDEVTHDHDWTKQDHPTHSGREVDRCDACGIYRAHVEGTPGRVYKLEMSMRASTDELLAELRRF